MNEMRNEMRREREEGVDSMNENKELNNTNNTNKEVKIMMKFIDIEKISKSIEIITLTELKELIKLYIEHNETLIIWGNYGIGKTQIVTQIVREVAQEMGVDLIEVNVPILNEEDVRGIRVYDEKRDEIICKISGPLSKLNPDRKTVIYLDELNRTKNRQILNLLRYIIREKEFLHIEITPEQKKNIVFIITANCEDKSLYELDAALLNTMGQVYLCITPI
jgi:MoxR-like ATPase